jgi:hypothetical protein
VFRVNPELLRLATEQIQNLMLCAIAFGAVVVGLLLGKYLHTWWTALPDCPRCYFGRVIPGDEVCIACKLEMS